MVIWKVSYYIVGYVLRGEYVEFDSECSHKCELGKFHRERKCIDKKWYAINKVPAESCEKNENLTMACLNLTNCGGSRNYLADGGMSCTEFCVSRKYRLYRNVFHYFHATLSMTVTLNLIASTSTYYF